MHKYIIYIKKTFCYISAPIYEIMTSKLPFKVYSPMFAGIKKLEPWEILYSLELHTMLPLPDMTFIAWNVFESAVRV